MNLSDLIARARVIATALVTWLVVISAILVQVSNELGAVAGLPEWLLPALGKAIAVIGVAILIIRRVTVVPLAERGVLPADPHKTSNIGG